MINIRKLSKRELICFIAEIGVYLPANVVLKTQLDKSESEFLHDVVTLATNYQVEEEELDFLSRFVSSYNEPNNDSYYCEEVPKYADVMSLDEWEELVSEGAFTDEDGFGNYAKEIDGKLMSCTDEVFGGFKPESATHVAWYNKQ